MLIITTLTLAAWLASASFAGAQTQVQLPDALLNPPGKMVPSALIPPSTNALAHTLSATNALAAWEELQASSHRPQTPTEWETKEPTDKEVTEFLTPYLLALVDKCKDFYTRFSNDTNAIESRKLEFELLTSMTEQMGATNQADRLKASEKGLLACTNLTEDERFGIRQQDVQRSAKAKESEGEAAIIAQFETDTRALQKEFPKRPEVLNMLLDVAAASEPVKARGILQEITNSPSATEETKTTATDELKKLDAIGKPVDLKVTAVDGREVDLAKMIGKVVMVEFWATWHHESVDEMPDLKSIYDKNHDKGLEMLGISLDRDKSNLTDFTTTNKLAWPQYFDSDHKYAEQYSIDSLPTIWLIDKKGNLRDINAGLDTEHKVAKLLAE